jgi:hypothetical protein
MQKAISLKNFSYLCTDEIRCGYDDNSNKSKRKYSQQAFQA